MFPDFIGIGAQKAGTTWLYANLRTHPQVWMPPIKEIHYFDHPTSTLAERLLGRMDYLREARAHLLRTIGALPRSRDRAALVWAARYCLLERGDDWYQSLFRRIAGSVAGEVSPSYARLAEDRIRRLNERMPTVKVIYLLRNPIDWAWSNAVMHLKRPPHHGIDRVSDELIAAHFAKAKSLAHADFLGNLRRWERHVERERIFVGFFDQLERDPGTLLKQVLEFLGIDSSDTAIPATVDARLNIGGTDGVPARFKSGLARLHIEQIAALHDRFGNAITNGWLDSATRCLAAASAGDAALA